MDAHDLIRRLKAHEDELKRFGVTGLSLFGSRARGDALPGSDIDIATTLDPKARIDLFGFAQISERLRCMLGAPIDLVVEPTSEPRFQAQIDRDRLRVF